MDLKLKGRKCLVTGASAGIGAAIVKALAMEGAMVVSTARRVDQLEIFADEVARAGGTRPIPVVGDLTAAEDVQHIAREAAAAVGSIEILVNCAGGSRPATIEDSDELWDQAMALNFTAGRKLSTELLPNMVRAGWGRIINVTSLMEPLSLNAAISAKAAFNLWAKGLSRDIASKGVTINTIAPGRIESEQVDRLWATDQSREEFSNKHIPKGYFGKPEDLAHLATFLASPLADYITGTTIPVDGGQKYSAV